MSFFLNYCWIMRKSCFLMKVGKKHFFPEVPRNFKGSRVESGWVGDWVQQTIVFMDGLAVILQWHSKPEYITSQFK